MKKIIAVAVATLFATAAFAQSATVEGMKQDGRAIKAEAKEAKADIKADAKEAKADIKASAHHAKAKVKHKAKRAKAKVKAAVQS